MVVSYAAHDRHLTSVARVQMLGSTQEHKMSDQDWPKKLPHAKVALHSHRAKEGQ
jgi:hypothetical protein